MPGVLGGSGVAVGETLKGQHRNFICGDEIGLYLECGGYTTFYMIKLHRITHTHICARTHAHTRSAYNNW